MHWAHFHYDVVVGGGAGLGGVRRVCLVAPYWERQKGEYTTHTGRLNQRLPDSSYHHQCTKRK